MTQLVTDLKKSGKDRPLEMGNAMQGVPRVHPEMGVERVGGRLLAAGPDDFIHSFPEEVGERIVELADGRRTVAQIVDALCEEFEVDRRVCEADTLEFVRLLVDKGVLAF